MDDSLVKNINELSIQYSINHRFMAVFKNQPFSLYLILKVDPSTAWPSISPSRVSNLLLSAQSKFIPMLATPFWLLLTAPWVDTPVLGRVNSCTLREGSNWPRPWNENMVTLSNFGYLLYQHKYIVIIRETIFTIGKNYTIRYIFIPKTIIFIPT